MSTPNTIEYSSNNSGGGWWLSDGDWFALEKAGWKIDWFKDQTDRLFSADKDGRWLGALATRASKVTTDPDAAISEWESITGEDSTAEGCNCCGEPHSFVWYDADGKSHWFEVQTTRTKNGWS